MDKNHGKPTRFILGIKNCGISTKTSGTPPFHPRPSCPATAQSMAGCQPGPKNSRVRGQNSWRNEKCWEFHRMFIWFSYGFSYDLVRDLNSVINYDNLSTLKWWLHQADELKCGFRPPWISLMAMLIGKVMQRNSIFWAVIASEFWDKARSRMMFSDGSNPGRVNLPPGGEKCPRFVQNTSWT